MPGEGQRGPMDTSADPWANPLADGLAYIRPPAKAPGPAGPASPSGPLDSYQQCMDHAATLDTVAGLIAGQGCISALASAPVSKVKIKNTMSPTDTWAGFATRIQAQTFIPGASGTWGSLWKLADTDYSCTFTSNATRLGAGLGASVTTLAVFFFNARNLGNIDGQEFGNGWSFDIDLPVSRLFKLAEQVQRAMKYAAIVQDLDGWLTLAQEVGAGITAKNSVVAIPLTSKGLIASFARTFGGTVKIGQYNTPLQSLANLHGD